MKKRFRPIILAGGKGSRLWPLSTEERPKQFIPIFKEFSLFDLSLQRFSKRELFKKPIIVTSGKYLNYVNSSLLRTGIEAEKIILEPESKNTYSAVSMAVMLALLKENSEDFLVTPSDQYISINKNFYDSCSLALEQLNEERLILMGVRPDHPSTEYGYISTTESSSLIKEVSKFTEKPNLKKSKALIREPGIFWNAGLFSFNGKWFIKRLKEIDNNFYKSLQKIVGKKNIQSNIFMPDINKFKKLDNLSFDVGFVEKISNIYMTELDAGWSDLGSWASLSNLQREPDSSMTLYSEGLYDKRDETWGYSATLLETESSKVRLLSVIAGKKFTPRKYRKKTEIWYVVRGNANLNKGENKLKLKTGDSVFLDREFVYEIENDTTDLLELIEIETDDYHEEKEINKVEASASRLDLH